MRQIAIILVVFIFPEVTGQVRVSFHDCMESALINHPRMEDKEILQKISENSSLNYSAAWLPELNLSGQATYQSDVIGFTFETPASGLDFPTAPKDQYKMYLDIRQTLYDAGSVKKNRELENVKLQASLIRTETEIESVKSSLIELYYATLALQENIELLKISGELLKKNREVVQSAVNNGTAMPSDADLLSVELMELEQEILNLGGKRSAILSVLSSLTGFKINENDLIETTFFDSPDPSLNRKELLLFDQNQQILGLTAQLKQSLRLPVAYAFGQFGYGNPGLNMLKDEFDTYYYVGLGFKWTIWDWNIVKREKANLVYQSELIKNQEREFTEAVERGKTKKASDIQIHQANISRFEEMLALREGITKSYESRLKEGTIRIIDYLAVLNQERILKIRLISEKVLFQKAIAEYMLLTGNL